MAEPEEFNVVLAGELKQIDERRRRRELADPLPAVGADPAGAAVQEAPPLEEVRKEARQRQLVGLAFSGGGIRSATFNLGFLQGLAGLKMLKIFDYLSTVSGGGYVGAWLTAWIQRRAAEMRESAVPGSAAAEVEEKLCPVQEQKSAAADKDELDPIEHLRRHSNYLAPRQGFLSIDTWVLWALYVRNFLLNQLVLLPSAVIVLLVSRLVMFAYYPTTASDGRLYGDYNAALGTFKRSVINTEWCYILIMVIAVAMTMALVNLVRAILSVRQEERKQNAKPETPGWLWRWIMPEREQDAQPKTPGWVRRWIVLPLVVSAVAFCPLIPNALPWTLWGYLSGGSVDLDVPWLLDLAVYMLVAAVAITVPYHIISYVKSKFKGAVGGWCFCTGLIWGAMIYGAFRFIDWFYAWDGLEPWQSLQISATAHMTTFGPPLLLLTMALANSLAIGLLRKHMGEELREWFASLCGWLMRAASVWALVNMVALYGTAIVLWAGPWAQTALGSGWLLTMAGGILAGGSELTGAPRPQNIYRELIARCTLPLFVVGIFILVSLLVHFAIDKPPAFDLTDESIVPYRYEAKYAPTHISVNRTGKDGHVEIKRGKEELRVPDEATAVQQRYWLSMLNTGNITRHYTFFLSDIDVRFLVKELVERRNVIDEEVLKERLVKLRPLKRWNYLELKKILSYNIPVDTDKSIIAAITRPVQRKEDERTTFAAASALAFMASSPEQGPYFASSAFLFDFPYPADLEFDPQIPKTANLSGSLGTRLESISYKQWQVEELQDEIDKVFPESWHQTTRRLVLQRIKGGSEPYVRIDQFAFISKILAWLVGCGLLVWLAANRVDVNAFSLHGLYLNRLVRAYLGASRKTELDTDADPGNHKPDPVTGFDPGKRKPDPVTGFDPYDDLLLAKLKSSSTESYDGPFPIMNAAMNLVHSDNLAWQERMAESFILTPEYCGSETTGYRPTDGAQKYADGIKLGTAVAISGAAASPNMGYHSSAAITFLLTVFNARLGAWLGNPKNEECWQHRGPQEGFLYLLKELFGLTDDKNSYVYLSDGGHFENLGAYELIKRRCRYVVVCDAGEDSTHAFEDLGNLVRKVRIDLGISIELSLDCLQLQKESRNCRWHCAIGKIRYNQVDPEASMGTLVYIKPSLTGDESADVLHYAGSHPTFPHETTANQFFTESQFESYRALGEHIAESVFKQSVDDTEEREKVPSVAGKGPQHLRWCRELFASLVRRWFAMPPDYDANFVTSTHGYIDLQEAWRNDPRLWRLTLDVYPELDPDGSRVPLERETPEECASREAAELHILLQMLQVIENAYLSLNLEKLYAHSMNRGWMDIFHRWTNSKAFHRYWPTVRGEFAREFVTFCERQMRKGEVTGVAVHLGRKGLKKLPHRLLQEFDQEWPGYKDEQDRNLKDSLSAEDTTAWAIYPVRAAESLAENPLPTDLPAGLIVVWPNLKAEGASPKEYYLLVWQRGAYRNAGLGRPAVRKVLSDLIDAFAHPFRLRVRLETTNLTGPGGMLQKAIWQTFFNQLDFVRTLPTAENEQETLLELQRDF